MLRDWKKETEERIAWIRKILAEAGAKGVVYANSGGKDCTLVSVLCKKATDNVVGIILPCCSTRNFNIDRDHALLASKKFGIRNIEVDLSPIKLSYVEALSGIEGIKITDMALSNINPRLRMITSYAVAHSLDYLVAGTGNRSEATVGYFTKWGDGAYDFNPIADLTVTEIFEFDRFLGVPDEIIDKAPSAGLWDGQTDEGELGITYAAIDKYLLKGEASDSDRKKIEDMSARSAHKRGMPKNYGSD